MAANFRRIALVRAARLLDLAIVSLTFIAALALGEDDGRLIGGRGLVFPRIDDLRAIHPHPYTVVRPSREGVSSGSEVESTRPPRRFRPVTLPAPERRKLEW